MNNYTVPTNFSSRLLEWFDHHGRKSLPWQGNKDPYLIWVSEIMLQQTQVTAVIPYFERFIAKFPTIHALADSTADNVMHHWSGLGYYARARNLHKAAKIIVDEHDGHFPQSINTVIALPGIGRSTAGAILAFAFNQRHPILDGNVKRILTRLFAIAGYPGSTKVSAKLWEIADDLTPDTRVDHYTQAIMDIGSTLCTRSNPSCTDCPFRNDCAAFASGNPTLYPTPKPKKTRPTKKVTMLVMKDISGNILLIKRPPTGIWGGLWSLPQLTENQTISEHLDYLGYSGFEAKQLPLLHHGFTHFELIISPQLIKVEPTHNQIMENREALWFDPIKPQSIGLPTAINKLLSSVS